MNHGKHFDKWSFRVIAITLGLFLRALITKSTTIK